ncbi:helix-hairpin-helix domain-containing protein [Chitinispirillales bacterium ANBcel5]|uniref:ComEA family DNA-binding protein n=1 Tax=Cellulosispirillum alkaliphilum TaxID=3039283 RepID=UPI002A52DB5F|nr:helix-hairpin-helix domain-containing protein [Chitinispirillales bacterium ANBcel5]
MKGRRVVLILMWITAILLLIYAGAPESSASGIEQIDSTGTVVSFDSTLKGNEVGLLYVSEPQKVELECIDINSASTDQLITLPGIGPVLAQRIIDYRDGTGDFKEKEELIKVKGIGPVRLEQIAEKLCP